jgi:hypothetical protein
MPLALRGEHRRNMGRSYAVYPLSGLDWVASNKRWKNTFGDTKGCYLIHTTGENLFGFFNITNMFIILETKVLHCVLSGPKVSYVAWLKYITFLRTLAALKSTFTFVKSSRQSFSASILVYLRDSHLKDLHEILYRAFSWKPVEKSHVWLKSGKNIAHFKWRALKS